eukprot:COSAG04_NODE_1781_length_5592_cov_3.678682_2_plen_76_part_00
MSSKWSGENFKTTTARAQKIAYSTISAYPNFRGSWKLKAAAATIVAEMAMLRGCTKRVRRHAAFYRGWVWARART